MEPIACSARDPACFPSPPPLFSCRQNPGLVWEAVSALGLSSVVHGSLYFEVTRDEEKNLKECVRRIDGGDAVRGGGRERCGRGRAAGGGTSGSRGDGSGP